MGLLKLMILTLCAAAATEAGAYPLSYSGRLTSANGQPVAGPVNLQVTFFADGTTTLPLIPAITKNNVALAEGVFSVVLDLNNADAQDVFADPALPPWIEVKDVTHSKTYPRQRFGVVPFALRVPNQVEKTYVDSHLGGKELDESSPTDGYVVKWDATNSKYYLDQDKEGVAGGGINTINGVNGSNQTLVIGTTGTAPNWTDDNVNEHTLHIPLAADPGVTAGLLSKAKFDEFDAKVATGDSRLSDARAPTAHAASHRNGGADEVATATPAANAIPKAGGGGTLGLGWLPSALTGKDADTVDGFEGTALEKTANKGANNGYAGLDGSGKVANSAINWAAPGAIGGVTPATGAFTSLTTTGSVGVGTTTPSAVLAVQSSSTGEMLNVERFQATTSGANLKLYHARGTVGAPGNLTGGDQAGYLAFYARGRNAGDTANDWIESSYVESVVEAVDGQGRIGGRLNLYTTPPGSGSRVNRVAIADTGEVGIGTTSPTEKLEVSGGIKMTAASGGVLTFADGTAQSTAAPAAVSCPAGFTSIEFNGKRLGCMQNDNDGSAICQTAMAACFAYGGRLPSLTEYAGAFGYYALLNEAGNHWNGSSYWNYVNGRHECGVYAAGNPSGDNAAVTHQYRCFIPGNGAGAGGVASEWSDGAGDDIYRNSGNVGIGTTSPVGKLHVQKTTTSLGLETDYAIRITEDGAAEDIGLLVGVVGGTTDAGVITTVDPNTGWSRNLSLQPNGGNVGIGTTNPGAKLEVAGSVRLGGRTFDQITYCSFSGAPNNNSTRFWRKWVGGDCDNGLPSGTCIGFIGKTYHGGNDQDWSVMYPGEVDPIGVAGTFTDGGMAWYTATPSGNVTIAATYFCD